MAIRYKNPQTGEYEVIKIPVMRGEQGHSGIHVGSDAPPTTDVKLWFDPSDTENDVDLANRLDTTLTACYDYMGNDRGSIKAAADANVDWLLGEINTVHHDGQHITATDSIEGRSKSAILKGQTLVNLLTRFMSNVSYIDNQFRIILSNVGNFDKITVVNKNSKPIRFSYYANNWKHHEVPAFGNILVDIPEEITTYNIFPLDTLGWESANYKSATDNIVLLHGDYANQDIPYFEGMQSVKMPVLKTTGSNMVNPADIEVIGCSSYDVDSDGIVNVVGDTTGYWARSYIRYAHHLKGNTTYYIYCDGDSTGTIQAEGWVGNINAGKISWNNFYKYTPETDVLYAAKIFLNTDASPFTCSKIRIGIFESTTKPSSFEPFKSNILTVNEEVELRGIGGVQDELDLLTGEVTERIGEVVLDGSEEWRIRNGDIVKYFDTIIENIFDGNLKISCISNKLQCYTGHEIHSKETYGLGASTNTIKLRIPNCLTVDELKLWLSQNPITVYYELATESIKTVDLSDNHVYSYKDVTHYDCSSEEGSLVPTLSIDVPTNLSALVTKQRQQIRTLEEENKELNQELQLAIASSEESDNELLAQSFELDFRLMEVEFALDLPMAATFRLGGKAMAMTPYEMAKKLILAGNYDRADMEHKLDVYVSKKRMTEAERQELIQLMNEKEGIVEIESAESEVEETVIEHEAVVIPLH